jgi:hypothetical protein
MLNWLKNVVHTVTESFGGEAPIRNGQAVTAIIKSKNIHIDLVPGGIFQHKDKEEIFFNIPTGDVGNNWIVTSPRQDIALLDNIASDKDNFRNVVRICKRIKDTYNFLVSSFGIETAVIIANSSDSISWENNLFIDLKKTLSAIADSFKSGHLPDSYDTSKNLFEGVDNLDWYAERIEKIINVLDLVHNNPTYDQAKTYTKVFNAFENN